MQGNNIYKGFRYVPKNDGDWIKDKTYEALTVVQYQGNSYTSKICVPRGIDILDTRFWIQTANYNQQFENLRDTFNATTSETIKELNDFKNKQDNEFADLLETHKDNVNAYVDEMSKELEAERDKIQQGGLNDVISQLNEMARKVIDINCKTFIVNNIEQFLIAIEKAKGYLNMSDVNIVLLKGFYKTKKIDFENFNYAKQLTILGAENQDVIIAGNGNELYEYTVEGNIKVFSGISSSTFSLYDLYTMSRIDYSVDYDENNCKMYRGEYYNGENKYGLKIDKNIPICDYEVIYIKDSFLGRYFTINTIDTSNSNYNLIITNEQFNINYSSTTDVQFLFLTVDVNKIKKDSFILKDNNLYVNSNSNIFYNSNTETIFNIKNSSNIKFENLKIGLTSDLQNTILNESRCGQSSAHISIKSIPSATIMIDNSINTEFSCCKIFNNGYNAFSLINSNNNIISNNIICNSNMGGIYLDCGCCYNNIIENEIYNIGQFVKHCCGILLKGISTIGGSNYNVIDKNLIHDMPYTAISIGYEWNFNGVNDNTMFTCRNTSITENVIYNIGINYNESLFEYNTLNDLGGIYVLGNLKDSVICDNVVAFIKGDNNFGVGLYIDESSCNFEVKNNYVYKTDVAYSQRGAGNMHNIQAHNNIFIGKIQISINSTDINTKFNNNKVIYDTLNNGEIMSTLICSQIVNNSFIVNELTNSTQLLVGKFRHFYNDVYKCDNIFFNINSIENIKDNISGYIRVLDCNKVNHIDNLIANSDNLSDYLNYDCSSATKLVLSKNTDINNIFAPDFNCKILKFHYLNTQSGSNVDKLYCKLPDIQLDTNFTDFYASVFMCADGLSTIYSTKSMEIKLDFYNGDNLIETKTKKISSNSDYFIKIDIQDKVPLMSNKVIISYIFNRPDFSPSSTLMWAYITQPFFAQINKKTSWYK